MGRLTPRSVVLPTRSSRFVTLRYRSRFLRFRCGNDRVVFPEKATRHRTLVRVSSRSSKVSRASQLRSIEKCNGHIPNRYSRWTLAREPASKASLTASRARSHAVGDLHILSLSRLSREDFPARHKTRTRVSLSQQAGARVGSLLLGPAIYCVRALSLSVSTSAEEAAHDVLDLKDGRPCRAGSERRRALKHGQPHALALHQPRHRLPVRPDHHDSLGLK